MKRAPRATIARGLLTMATAACLLVGCQRLEGADARTEFYDRVAKVPVRNAEAFVDLGLWCQSAGLQDKAAECFQRAISIDRDCEKARLALGHRRYGTGWLKPGESPRPQARLPSPVPAPDREAGKEAPATESPDAAAAPQGAAGGSGAAAPAGKAGKPAGTGAPASESEGPSGAAKTQPAPEKPEEPPAPKPEEKPAATPGGEEAGSEGLEVEVKAKKPKDTPGGKASSAEIEKKRAMAQAAADKIGVTFFTYEDGDFMVHSTLSTSSREVKTLLSNLKSLKRVLSQMVGSGSGTKIWPDKLQFFLLKSEPEFERFAETVDGIKSAKNPDGAYAQGSHTVILDPDTEVLPRVLGESCLDKLGGSNRYVGWWLKQGIGELLYAQSAAGQKKLYYPQTMRFAADIIQAEGQGLKIFNLIETADYKPKDKDRNQALALSLLDYLFKKSRSGVRDLVTALKSDKAPAPPSTTEEFKAFFNLSYRSFQEEALRSAFHMPVDALGEQWKAYVLAVVDKLKSDEAAKAADAAKKSTGKKDKRAK